MRIHSLACNLPFWITVFDDEQNQDSQNDNQDSQNENQDSQNENQDSQNDDSQSKEKKFTQADVDRLLNEKVKKLNLNRNELVSQLKELRGTVKMTDKQREDLEARIEQLQNETLSNQELQKRDREKLVKEHDRERKKLQSEADSWRGLYTEEKLHRELLDAAIANDAISPSQIVNMLRPSSKLVPEIDKSTGQETGRWAGRVTISDTDEEGKAINLELPIPEAIARFAEMPDNWNLFKKTASSGLGSFNNTGHRNLNGVKPPKDPKQYRQWRDANLGAKKR